MSPAVESGDFLQVEVQVVRVLEVGTVRRDRQQHPGSVTVPRPSLLSPPGRRLGPEVALWFGNELLTQGHLTGLALGVRLPLRCHCIFLAQCTPLWPVGPSGPEAGSPQTPAES